MGRTPLFLFLAACFSKKDGAADDTSGFTCGAGTHAEGSTCVADEDTDTGGDSGVDTDTGSSDTDTGALGQRTPYAMTESRPTRTFRTP